MMMMIMKINAIHFHAQFKHPRLLLQWLAYLFLIIYTSTYKTYVCELDVFINVQAPITRVTHASNDSMLHFFGRFFALCQLLCTY